MPHSARKAGGGVEIGACDVWQHAGVCWGVERARESVV